MAGRRFKVGPRITVQLHNEEFVRLRKVQPLANLFSARGKSWTDRLNTDLAAAQVKRKQPVEDGYTFHISSHGTRLRLYVLTYTARAYAHERKHSSILKLMETTRYEVKMRHELTPAQQKVEAQAKAASVRNARERARAKAKRDKANDA